MAVRGAFSPLSRLIFEIVYSIGQENFTFVRKKSGNFRNRPACGNRDLHGSHNPNVCLKQTKVAVNLPPFPFNPWYSG